MKYLSITLSFCILTSLIGCNVLTKNTPNSTGTASTAYPILTPSTIDYPTPLGAKSYPAPGVTEEAIIIEIVPTPNSLDKATITGYLYNKTGDNIEPATSVVLYLAEVMYHENTPIVAGFDRSSPLKTLTDNNGRFVFTDVPFKTYSIVVDKISEAYLLYNPDTDGDLLIEVKESIIYDLGDLTFGSLPE